jgi:BolA family transcriptional regulator, general stress-responsive regulator
MTDTTESLRALLVGALSPERLVIEDEGHLHAGHAGAKAHGGGHFRVTVVSAAFEGLGPIARHRRVYAALATLMTSRVHALALTTLTPAEDAHSG